MRNYKEAAKCFEQALKYNPDNFQVHRDACNLYLHSRDYISYKETSRKFLVKKPELLSGWCNYALACNMSLDYEQAIDNIDSLLEISAEDKNVDNVSRYNILLYKAELLKNSGRNDDLISFLLKNKSNFLNKLEYARYLADAYLLKEDKEQAKKYLLYLVKLLPENKEFMVQYAKLSQEGIIGGLKALKSEIKSSILDSVILEFYEDKDIEDFKSDYSSFLIYNAGRYSPNFIQDIKCFANTDKKREVIKQQYKDNINSLKENKKLINGKEVQDPTYLLFMLSQYSAFLYWRKDYQPALSYIDEAIEHTCTFQDLYVLKAKILKKIGRIEEAIEVAEVYQSLDTADRCLTKAAVKILLVGGKIVRADNLFKRFMQQNSLTEKNVHDLQKLTYELRLANAYTNKLNFARGLRLYKMIIEHIDEFKDDQHDFYTFCLRKFLVKNLLDVIRFNDVTIKKSQIFTKTHVKYVENLVAYSKFKDKGFNGVTSDSEVVEVNAETDKSLDISGTMFLAKLNVEEEVRNAIKNLNLVKMTEIEPKLITRVNSILFDYYLKTDKIIPCLRAYYYLLENELTTFDNKIRKHQIENKLKTLDLSKLSETENIMTEEFKNTKDSKYKVYLSKFDQNNKYKDSEILSNLIDIILKNKLEDKEDKDVADDIVNFCNKLDTDQLKSLTFKVN